MTSLASLPQATGRKALVTGSAGFIGRHFVDWLENLDWDVTQIDLKDNSDAVDFYRHSDEYFDLVVHAAYHVGGRVAIDGNNLLLAENLQLDSAALNFALKTKPGHFLYFSSSAAYPIRLQNGDIPHRLRESDITVIPDRFSPTYLRHPEPDAHYGWAKLTGERLAQQAQQLGVNVHVVRPFSGYGEDQGFDYPFCSIVERAIEKDFTVWGPPEQTRDWIHVDDVIEGCWAIMRANSQAPTNLCTGKSTTMGRLLKLATGIAHGLTLADDQITYLLDKPTGVIQRVGHPENFFKLYRPQVSLREGVERALAVL